PFQVADEPAHFLRAFQLARGQLTAIGTDSQPGGLPPAAMIEFFRAFGIPDDTRAGLRSAIRVEDPFTTYWDAARQFQIGTEEHEFIACPQPVGYSPMCYLPQACGIRIARCFTGSLLVALYSARIANLMWYVILVSLAIQITPILKWTFVLLSLTPM